MINTVNITPAKHQHVGIVIVIAFSSKRCCAKQHCLRAASMAAEYSNCYLAVNEAFKTTKHCDREQTEGEKQKISPSVCVRVC